MKLLYCQECTDIVRLRVNQIRSCQCGKCSGEYVDKKLVRVSENAILIGFDNPSLKKALKHIPDDGQGEQFVAFIIPRKCDCVVIDPRLNNPEIKP